MIEDFLNSFEHDDDETSQHHEKMDEKLGKKQVDKVERKDEHFQGGALVEGEGDNAYRGGSFVHNDMENSWSPSNNNEDEDDGKGDIQAISDGPFCELDEQEVQNEREQFRRYLEIEEEIRRCNADIDELSVIEAEREELMLEREQMDMAEVAETDRQSQENSYQQDQRMRRYQRMMVEDSIDGLQ